MKLETEERELVLTALDQYGRFVKTRIGEEKEAMSYFELFDKIVKQDGIE